MKSPQNNFDLFFSKFSPDGSQLWLKEIAGPGSDLPSAGSVAINNFGSVQVNNTVGSGFLVFNNGDGNLSVSSVVSTNNQFTATPAIAEVLPNKFQQFIVKFKPSMLGSDSGYIVLLHNAGSNLDSLKVIGKGTGSQGSVSMSVTLGWNLVSLPLVMTDSRKKVLFPTATSGAFTFSAAGYTIRDTMETGVGYWLKFDSLQTILLTSVVQDSNVINVKYGWNLIGSLSYSIPVSSIIQEPPNIVISNYYDFNVSYFAVTELLPGKGYWVKTNQSGKLKLKQP